MMQGNTQSSSETQPDGEALSHERFRVTKLANSPRNSHGCSATYMMPVSRKILFRQGTKPFRMQTQLRRLHQRHAESRCR
jgi:hypothetical protein